MIVCLDLFCFPFSSMFVSTSHVLFFFFGQDVRTIILNKTFRGLSQFGFKLIVSTVIIILENICWNFGYNFRKKNPLML